MLDQLLLGQSGSLIEFEHESTTSQRKTLLIKAQVLSTEGTRVLLLMVEDISLRREAERLIAKEKEALESEIAVAARRLNRTQEELRGLTAHLLLVQEEERQRVARELHDDISQRLSLLEIALQEIDAAEGKQPAEDRVKTVRDQVHALNTDVRTLSHRLHPAILNDLGLPAALKALVTEFGRREEMPATYSSHDVPEQVPERAAIALYRIAQEALRNVAKHAGKTHVKVMLSGTKNGLQLKVMDFGLGFDQDAEPATPGLGMISMQERARLAGGTLEVQSSLGHGTTITVEVPLEDHA
jgi:two-component system CheB/CheR fusion protein